MVYKQESKTVGAGRKALFHAEQITEKRTIELASCVDEDTSLPSLFTCD
jgi:hypothetical protein